MAEKPIKVATIASIVSSVVSVLVVCGFMIKIGAFARSIEIVTKAEYEDRQQIEKIRSEGTELSRREMSHQESINMEQNRRIATLEDFCKSQAIIQADLSVLKKDVANLSSRLEHLVSLLDELVKNKYKAP